MTSQAAYSDFLALARPERERLFLDVLETPPFACKGSWAEWFHAWLEDQSAEGRTLGQIARHIDLPEFSAENYTPAWCFLERHICWMLQGGYARVVRIDIVA